MNDDKKSFNTDKLNGTLRELYLQSLARREELEKEYLKLHKEYNILVEELLQTRQKLEEGDGNAEIDLPIDKKLNMTKEKMLKLYDEIFT